jgi:hypothetical protein
MYVRGVGRLDDTTTATRSALDELRAQFSNTNGYLAACTADS